MFKTTASVLASLTLAAALAGCPGVDGIDPIVSEWKSNDPIGGYYNNLEIDDDLHGEATIYYYASDGYLYMAEFDVEAEIRDGGEYALSLECNGDCAWLDVEMECELNDEADELDCEGEGNWAQYIFEWKLD